MHTQNNKAKFNKWPSAALNKGSNTNNKIQKYTNTFLKRLTCFNLFFARNKKDAHFFKTLSLPEGWPAPTEDLFSSPGEQFVQYFYHYI